MSEFIEKMRKKKSLVGFGHNPCLRKYLIFQVTFKKVWPLKILEVKADLPVFRFLKLRKVVGWDFGCDPIIVAAGFARK